MGQVCRSKSSHRTSSERSSKLYPSKGIYSPDACMHTTYPLLPTLLQISPLRSKHHIPLLPCLFLADISSALSDLASLHWRLGDPLFRILVWFLELEHPFGDLAPARTEHIGDCPEVRGIEVGEKGYSSSRLARTARTPNTMDIGLCGLGKVWADQLSYASGLTVGPP